MIARDDLTGKLLDPVKVLEARRLEMEYFKAHEVYVKVALEECYRVTGKAPIKGRWIDTD